MKVHKNNLQGIDRCVHCGIAAPHMVGVAHKWTHGRWWLMFECQSCGQVAMARLAPSPANTFEGTAVEQIYPSPRTVEEDLPERAKEYLRQAFRSFAAPDGAAMLFGSAVDAMLKAKGFKDGSVHKRINDAVASGVLTQDMADWAHEVRLASNQPRHADEAEPHVTEEEAKALAEFVTMLGHILFTLPSRVKRRRSTP